MLMNISLVLFDRDGTLNKRYVNGYVMTKSDLHFPPDIDTLRHLNYVNVGIVTNQSCIGRGLVTLDQVSSLTHSMREKFSSISRFDVFICPHVPDDECECRKPHAGLIKQALQFFGVPPSNTLLVGDSISDLEAAQECCVPFRAVCWDSKCWSADCLHSLSNVVNLVNISQQKKGLTNL